MACQKSLSILHLMNFLCIIFYNMHIQKKGGGGGEVGDFCSSLELFVMKANSHFGTLRYPLIMYTILFTYVVHYLNEK